MDASIHQHVIACKIQDDMRAATDARAASAAVRETRRVPRLARVRRLLRRPARSPATQQWSSVN
jgi:hypothetical protein